MVDVGRTDKIATVVPSGRWQSVRRSIVGGSGDSLDQINRRAHARDSSADNHNSGIAEGFIPDGNLWVRLIASHLCGQ